MITSVIINRVMMCRAKKWGVQSRKMRNGDRSRRARNRRTETQWARKTENYDKIYRKERNCFQKNRCMFDRIQKDLEHLFINFQFSRALWGINVEGLVFIVILFSRGNLMNCLAKWFSAGSFSVRNATEDVKS